MQPDPIVIVSAVRTPMGAFQGELKGFAAPQLGAAAIRAAVERATASALRRPSRARMRSASLRIVVLILASCASADFVARLV